MMEEAERAKALAHICSMCEPYALGWRAERVVEGPPIFSGGWRLTQKRQLNAEPRNFEAAAQPIDVGFTGQAGAIRRGGGRSWRPPSQDRTAWARIRRQR